MKRLIIYPSILSLTFLAFDIVQQDIATADAVRHVAEYERYNMVLDAGYANEADWAWIHSGICADDSACAEVDAVERLHIENETLSFTDER